MSVTDMFGLTLKTSRVMISLAVIDMALSSYIMRTRVPIIPGSGFDIYQGWE
jgi:hypothetical protein